MHRLAGRYGLIDGGGQHRVGEEVAVGDRFVQPGQIPYTMRPAPVLTWPTSELPICPSGRPTSSPEAAISVCGCSPQAIHHRSAGVQDRVVLPLFTMA